MDSQSPITFNGDSPLHVAVRQGQIEDVRNILFQQQVDVNVLNSKHETPLHLACSKEDSAIVELLIAFGADPYIKDSNDNIVYGRGIFDIQNIMNKLLHGYGLWINGPSMTSGDTPLHTSVRLGVLENIQRTVNYQVIDVNVMNSAHETPLHLACALGHKHVVHTLVSKGADLYARDCYNNTPIHRAVSQGHVAVMDSLLIDFLCKPMIKGYQGRTLLHFACGIGNVNLVSTLIEKHGISPMAADAINQTPLHIAASHGQEEVVCLLITKYNSPVDCRSNYKLSPLHLASYCGHVSVANLLVLKYKADVNALDEAGSTPFLKAAMSGNLELVEMMITNFDIDPLSATDDGGYTPLHMACGCGHEELAKLFITKYNCLVDVVSKNKMTPLHLACSFGCLSIVKMLILEYDANLHAVNHENSTPLHAAVLNGHLEIMQTLIIEFGCSPQVKGFEGYSLLHYACYEGMTKLVKPLITEFNLNPLSVDDNGETPLHMACMCGHEELARLLIIKYNCPVDIKSKNKETPLHRACWSGHLNVVRMLILEFKADINAKDYQNSTPLSRAASDGNVDIMQMLISEFSCSPNVKGFEGRSLLHYACGKGNVLTAITLIQEFPSLIHTTDNYGNSPLNLSSLFGQAECVRLLLFEYHAPVFIRNKAGKTALDFAKDESIKKMFKEYMSSEHKNIQQEYEKLQTLSLKKYAGSQIITRVFVLGYPGSGKSTLVESLKRKGVISSRLLVTEADVPPHTAGIVPSIYQSKKAGRLLYYDFPGDGEYYSSHGAILEMVSHSSVGTNVYVIVANLTKDGMTLCNEIGYWLTFISYHAMNVDSQHTLKVVVVLSHSDCLTLADSTNRLNSIKQYLRNQKDNCNIQKLSIIDILSSDCRRPRSSQVIEDTLQQISRDIPPCSISFETSLLHGLLQKDFGNVVACKLHDLLIHIKDTGICLPTVAKELYPLVKELHEIGVLMMIGQNKDQCENHFSLLDPASLTNEVHQQLFSDSARQIFSSSVNPYYANMGILPERYLTSILPEHITKECLIQLQYCQEFSHAEVGLNYLVTPDDALNDHLLYFPVLCKLESEQNDWATDPKLTFSIGWYTKCTGKFDYFPARYLHVLLLRLAFTFALPIANCNITESNQISAHNRRCTMWKNGIRWLMEEGVECIFEVVNDNKGIVIITKSEEHSKEWAIILSKIIEKAMQAKAEFCDSISLRHFLLNSNDTLSFVYEDKLFAISDVEHVIREGKKKVISVNGQAFLDSSHLCVLKKYTYWGKLMLLSEMHAMGLLK